MKTVLFKERWKLIMSCGLLMVSFLLLLFLTWVYWVELPALRKDVSAKKADLQALVTQQSTLVDSEKRLFLQDYSELLLAIDDLLSQRKGMIQYSDDASVGGFLVLDILRFFEDFFDRLSQKSLVNNLSISEEGQVSFLVQTPSYTLAAEQISFLKEEWFFDQQEEQDDELQPVVLFDDVQISSIQRTEWSPSDSEIIPELFALEAASYDFLVQAQIHQDFFLHDASFSTNDPQN